MIIQTERETSSKMTTTTRSSQFHFPYFQAYTMSTIRLALLVFSLKYVCVPTMMSLNPILRLKIMKMTKDTTPAISHRSANLMSARIS